MVTTVEAVVRRRSPVINGNVRTFIGAAVLGLLATAAPAANAADSCKMALCMWGRLTGDSGGSECSSAEKDYFAILVKKKHNKINWSSTAKKRLQALNSCSGSDPSYNSQINSKFGKKRG